MIPKIAIRQPRGPGFGLPFIAYCVTPTFLRIFHARSREEAVTVADEWAANNFSRPCHTRVRFRH